MDPYLARFAFFWYNDEEIFHDTQEEIDEKVRCYARQGLTHLITFSCTHFRWSFQSYWGLLNECLARIVRSAHKNGLKVIEHHSAELSHLADTPEQRERLKRILSFRKSSLDSWKGLTEYLQDRSSDARKWEQIDGKTGKPYINTYMGTGKCYNDPEYRKAYLTYLESVYSTGVDGIMTDDVQYYCFCACPHCRKLFREKYGHTLPSPEKWAEWFGNMKDPSFVDFLRFRLDSTHDFHVMVKEQYDRLGLKMLRPNYHSFAFSDDAQACGIDELPEMHWYFQECALSCVTRYSFLKSAGEQKHRAMVAKARKIPHGILNYAYDRDELVFSWGVAMLSGAFYINTPEGGEMVDETSIRAFERKHASRLFHCEEFAPAGFLHSQKNRRFSPGYNMSRMEAWLQMCILKNVPSVLVNVDDPGSWRKCSLLCVNEVHMLSDPEICSLKQYVEEGGVLVLSGQCGTQKETVLPRTKEELEAVWGFSFAARNGTGPALIPHGKGKFCIVPDDFGYPLEKEDIQKMFGTNHMDFPFQNAYYELMRNAPFVTADPHRREEKRESVITERWKGLLKSAPEVVQLFRTLAPPAFTAELPEGILAAPYRSTEEKSITVRLLNTTDALLVKDPGNFVTKADRIEWKKWQGPDGVFTFRLSPGEAVRKGFFTDLSGKEIPLSCTSPGDGLWKIVLPAGLLEDFGCVVLEV
ncbi:MAG: hypothetical protein J6331_07375 [Lentisphaeria bacterium]|nr:hypothetical protein [Lentisphaeria bacterium]